MGPLTNVRASSNQQREKRQVAEDSDLPKLVYLSRFESLSIEIMLFFGTVSKDIPIASRRACIDDQIRVVSHRLNYLE